jgi:hypothetical protein
VPVAVDEPAVRTTVASRIDAALGLPTRVPGATLSSLPSLAGPSEPPALRDLPPRPSPEQPIEPPASQAPRQAPEIAGATVPPPEPPPEPPLELAADAASTPTTSVAAPVTAPVPDLVDEISPAAAVLDPLAAPLRLLSGEDAAREDDTPIFRQMRSAWLSAGGAVEPWTSSEVEAGWDVADRVAAASAAPVLTASGLPMRRPGAYLVPGGVTKPASTVARDPEAVRARLAAHAAGVSRGRHAVSGTDNPLPQEDLA